MGCPNFMGAPITETRFGDALVDMHLANKTERFPSTWLPNIPNVAPNPIATLPTDPSFIIGAAMMLTM